MSKQQSAMEYLMTYGWAILIIAVVLGALFQLGVFNSSSFSPRAPPGACQVFRTNGPGTVTNINLMGVCTGQLPQYVAKFNGASSYISTGTFGFPLGASPSSFVGWVYITSASVGPIIFNYGTVAANKLALLYDDGSNVAFYNGGIAYSGPALSLNAWHFVGWSYGGGTSLTLYVDTQSTAVNVAQENVTLGTTHPSVIGAYGQPTLSQYLPGSLANFQLYNASLSANQIQALYLEGIGGAPMKLQNLVGWWPLNGNANDYSGNNNNGVPASVTFTSQYGK